MDTSNVDTVIIAGTVKKRGGRLVGVDMALVTRLADQSRDFIFSKTGWSRGILGDR
jgi:5-methylthioadenosine/S-adenosylhomocysteine deaminase